MPGETITIACSLPGCTKPLIKNKKQWLCAKGKGQKRFYHKDCSLKKPNAPFMLFPKKKDVMWGPRIY